MYRLCIPGRAPRTKETLPDFREKCRVTRHSRVFSWVDGKSTDPWDLGPSQVRLINEWIIECQELVGCWNWS